MVNKLTLQIALCLIFLCACRAQYEMRFPNSYYLPEKWPQHTVQLSEQGTLKDIFDSGIRPYFLPNGREYSQLEFKHVRLRIQQPDGTLLPEFAVDYADVRPKPSGLAVLDLTGHALTLESARYEMSKWLPYIGKTADELDLFLSKVKADYSGFDDRDFGAAPDGFKGKWTGKNKERYVVWLQKAYSEEVPVRMKLMIGWELARTPREKNTFYKGSIPSPEGYEDYQIQETKHSGPDSMSEMMYAKGIPFSPGTGLGGSISNVIEKDEDPSVMPDSRPEKHTPIRVNLAL